MITIRETEYQSVYNRERERTDREAEQNVNIMSIYVAAELSVSALAMEQ